MSTDPEVIRADIERTRTELSRDVDALGEKVSPTHAARRQADRVRGRMTRIKDRVMGSAHDVMDTAEEARHEAADSVRGAASSVADTVSSAPQAVRQQTQGNPLAAGLVAFGLGLLVSSLVPASQAEARMATRVKEKTEPLMEDAKQVAKEVAQDLREPAKEQLRAMQDSAKEAAREVGEHGREAVRGVGEQGRETAEQVRPSETGDLRRTSTTEYPPPTTTGEG